MSKRSTTIILLSVLFISAGIFFYFYDQARKQNEKELPILGQPGHIVGSFAFLDQDSTLISNADVDGKIRVVEYFFTTCKGICPEMNENMRYVYDANKGDDRFVILSHTVNPEVDTVPVMRAYAQKFQADVHYWKFLTGNKQELYDMARYSYLITASDPSPELAIEDDFIHSEKFVLVDPQNRIRGQYDGTDLEDVQKLIADIEILKKESSADAPLN